MNRYLFFSLLSISIYSFEVFSAHGELNWVETDNVAVNLNSVAGNSVIRFIKDGDLTELKKVIQRRPHFEKQNQALTEALKIGDKEVITFILQSVASVDQLNAASMDLLKNHFLGNIQLFNEIDLSIVSSLMKNFKGAPLKLLKKKQKEASKGNAKKIQEASSPAETAEADEPEKTVEDLLKEFHKLDAKKKKKKKKKPSDRNSKDSKLDTADHELPKKMFSINALMKASEQVRDDLKRDEEGQDVEVVPDCEVIDCFSD